MLPSLDLTRRVAGLAPGRPGAAGLLAPKAAAGRVPTACLFVGTPRAEGETPAKWRSTVTLCLPMRRMTPVWGQYLMRRCCSHCRTDFRPKRSDARYCSNLCREAAHRMRKKDVEATTAAAVVAQRKAVALRVLDQLDAHRHIAAILHAQAKADGIEVSFMPAASGVIAVETRPGALDEADTLIAGFPYLSREGAVSEDAVRAILSSKNIGGSVIAREAEAECRQAVARGGNVYELRADPDFIAARNRAARFRNDGATFLGLLGFRCSCGKSRAGRDEWMCCGEPFDIDTPDGRAASRTREASPVTDKSRKRLIFHNFSV
jgi:hypothetical protein